jgi:hypothetical protein
MTSTRQYARHVSKWVGGIGLDPSKFATHSLRRTTATLLYRRTGNLRGNSCSAIRRLKAPCGILASRSMMPLRSPDV